MINILCTSKPGDGLLCYSYEHCHYLNSMDIDSQLCIVTHPKFEPEDYQKALDEKYGSIDVPLGFDERLNYTTALNDITIIMGRSMLTLPYLDRHRYNPLQLNILHKLLSRKLISVYSENHPKDYDIALNYFKPEMVKDLCDYDVYPNGVGEQYQKMINFSCYKYHFDKIEFDYLFLGTNEIYYEEVMKHIDKYPSHGILTYDEKWINKKYNNIFVPVRNLLGCFKTYVYTKSYFDPAPRLIQECKWLNKGIIYARDSNIKDGGLVYMGRPVPTEKMYSDNINILVKAIQPMWPQRHLL